MEDSEDSFGMDGDFTNVFDSRNNQQLEEPKSPFEWDHPSLSPLSENAEEAEEGNEQQQLDSTEIYDQNAKGSLELEDISEDEKAVHNREPQDGGEETYEDDQQAFQERDSGELEGDAEYEDDGGGMEGPDESAEYYDTGEYAEEEEMDESGENAEAVPVGSSEHVEEAEGTLNLEGSEKEGCVEDPNASSEDVHGADEIAEVSHEEEEEYVEGPNKSSKNVHGTDEIAEVSHAPVENAVHDELKEHGESSNQVQESHEEEEKSETVEEGTDSGNVKEDQKEEKETVNNVQETEGDGTRKNDDGKIDKRPDLFNPETGKSSSSHSSKKHSEKKRHRSGKLKKHKKKRSKIERRFSSADDTPDELQNLDDILKRLEDLPLDNESNKAEDNDDIDPDKLSTVTDGDTASKLENKHEKNNKAVESTSTPESSAEDESSGSASSVNDNVEPDTTATKASNESNEEKDCTNVDDASKESENVTEPTENETSPSRFKNRLKGVCLERLNLDENFRFLDKELKIIFPDELTEGKFLKAESTDGVGEILEDKKAANENGLDLNESNDKEDSNESNYKEDSNESNDKEDQENDTTSMKSNTDTLIPATDLNEAEMDTQQSENNVPSQKGKKTSRKSFAKKTARKSFSKKTVRKSVSNEIKPTDTECKEPEMEPEQNEGDKENAVADDSIQGIESDEQNDTTVSGKRSTRNVKVKTNSVQVKDDKATAKSDVGTSDKEITTTQGEETNEMHETPTKSDTRKGKKKRMFGIQKRKQNSPGKTLAVSESKVDDPCTNAFNGDPDKTVKKTKGKQSKKSKVVEDNFNEEIVEKSENLNSNELDSNKPENNPDDQGARVSNGHGEKDIRKTRTRLPKPEIGTKDSPNKTGRSSRRLSINKTTQDQDTDDTQDEMPLKKFRGQPLKTKTKTVVKDINVDDQDDHKISDSAQKRGRKTFKGKSFRKRSADTALDEVVDELSAAISEPKTAESDSNKLDHLDDMNGQGCLLENIRECTVRVSRLSFPIFYTLRRCAVSVDPLPITLVPAEGTCIFLSKDLIMKYCRVTVQDKRNKANSKGKTLVSFNLPKPVSKPKVLSPRKAPAVQEAVTYTPKRSSRKTASPYKRSGGRKR